MKKKFEDYATFKIRIKNYYLSPKQLIEWTESDYVEAYNNHYDRYAATIMDENDEVQVITTNKREADSPAENQSPPKKTTMDKFIAELQSTKPPPDVGSAAFTNLLAKYGLTYQDYGDYINKRSADESMAQGYADQEQANKNKEGQEKARLIDEAEKEKLRLHPNLLTDPLHGQYYTIIRGGKKDGSDLWQCTENDINDVLKNCFMDWWTEDQWDLLAAKWKKEHPYTYTQLYNQLNANRGYWREINKNIYQVPDPYDKNDFNSVKYYDHDVPRAGALLDWFNSSNFKQWANTDSGKELQGLYAAIKGTNMDASIAAHNAKHSLDDTGAFIKNIPKAISDFFDTTGFKVFLVAILGIAALGSGAALVHEVRK